MNVPQTASGRPRDRRPGSPLNAPPIPASNFVLGEGLAYSRDDGTPGCGRRWKRSSAAFELGAPVAFAFGMAGIAAVLDQLPAGAIVALQDDCYQGVAGLADAGRRRGRWTMHRVQVTDTRAASDAAAVERGYRAVDDVWSDLERALRVDAQPGDYGLEAPSKPSRPDSTVCGEASCGRVWLGIRDDFRHYLVHAA
jgi:hypothetical protein